MRVLIDIKHPAEANFFRPLIERLKRRGDAVLITAHYKPLVEAVLDGLGLEHVRVSGPWPTPVGIVASAMARAARMLRVAAAFRPHVMVSRVGVEIGAVGRLLRIPAVVFDENEYASCQLWLAARLATVICTGMGYEKDLGARQVRFNALSQLAYTHPARFTPDAAGLRAHGIEPEQPYVVVRLGGWQALHDIGRWGLSDEAAVELVEHLCAQCRVVVTSERPMPAALAPHANPVPVENAFDLLAFARLYVGEGGSMAAEAACLGTHAVWLSALRCGYLSVLQDRYGLVTQLCDLEEAKRVTHRMLADGAVQQETARARERLLAESEDPLDFMVEVVERYALGS